MSMTEARFWKELAAELALRWSPGNGPGAPDWNTSHGTSASAKGRCAECGRKGGWHDIGCKSNPHHEDCNECGLSLRLHGPTRDCPPTRADVQPVADPDLIADPLRDAEGREFNILEEIRRCEVLGGVNAIRARETQKALARLSRRRQREWELAEGLIGRPSTEARKRAVAEMKAGLKGWKRRQTAVVVRGKAIPLPTTPSALAQVFGEADRLARQEQVLNGKAVPRMEPVALRSKIAAGENVIAEAKELDTPRLAKALHAFKSILQVRDRAECEQMWVGMKVTFQRREGVVAAVGDASVTVRFQAGESKKCKPHQLTYNLRQARVRGKRAHRTEVAATVVATAPQVKRAMRPKARTAPLSRHALVAGVKAAIRDNVRRQDAAWKARQRKNRAA